MTGDEFTAALLEGIHEKFAWLLRDAKQRNHEFSPNELDHLRFGFKVGFCLGVCWQLKRGTAAGIKPA